MKKIFIQNDDKWKNISRYHAGAADSLGELDQMLIDRISDGQVPDGNAVLSEYIKFGQAIRDVIENGLPNGSKNYPLSKYGCWDCSVAMILNHFDVQIFEYGKDKKLKADPATVIKALRSWQILSPSGYAYDLFNDPVSIISKGAMQLIMHEDYGEDGVKPHEANILNFVTNLKGNVGILVCVKGHAAFGKNESSHWMAIDPEKLEVEGKFIACDPSHGKQQSLNLYKKVYEVCVYAKSENIKKIFNP